MSRYWETEPEMSDLEFGGYQAELEESIQNLVDFARTTTPDDGTLEDAPTWWARLLAWFRGW
jgi:hypothetical protein